MEGLGIIKFVLTSTFFGFRKEGNISDCCENFYDRTYCKNFLNFIIKTSLVLIIFLSSLTGFTQSGRQPANGANGIPGQFTRSFVISWPKMPGAVKYEYVLTTNPNCFKGCAGDTRQRIVYDTSAFEFALQENTWYYWIVRSYQNDSVDNGWSSIYSFLAKDIVDENETIQFYPNPSTSENISIFIDWSTDPSLREFSVDVLNTFGTPAMPSSSYAKSGGGYKFESFYLDIAGLTSGVYSMVITFKNDSNSQSKRLIKRLIVP